MSNRRGGRGDDSDEDDEELDGGNNNHNHNHYSSQSINVQCDTRVAGRMEAKPSETFKSSEDGSTCQTHGLVDCLLCNLQSSRQRTSMSNSYNNSLILLVTCKRIFNQLIPIIFLSLSLIDPRIIDIYMAFKGLKFFDDVNHFRIANIRAIFFKRNTKHTNAAAWHIHAIF